MFAPNGGYYANYHFVFKTHSFLKFGEYHSDIPHPNAFRPVARERKYLMDYKMEYLQKYFHPKMAKKMRTFTLPGNKIFLYEK